MTTKPKKSRILKSKGSADTSSSTSTKTQTSTSTKADTRGNVTVTGGAGNGDTVVTIAGGSDKKTGAPSALKKKK